MSSSIGQIEDILLTDIFADEQFNCRGKIVPIDVLDLIRDIEKNGLQNPVIVQPYTEKAGKKFRLVAGYRRYTAHTVIQGKTTIPCIVKQGLDELSARKINLQENLIRKELNIQQEAKAIHPFKLAGYTMDQIAAEFQQSRGWVQVRWMLLDLDQDIQSEAAAGMLNQEQIRQVWQLKPEHRHEAVKEIKDRRAKGEKKILLKKTKNKNVNKRIRREKEEIEEMIEAVAHVLGMGFHTRLLAWTAGNISTTELMFDFRDYCEQNGYDFKIPEEIRASMDQVPE